MKALLIGCGNIGALYDIDTDEVKTHAKALSFLPDISVTVFDEDAEQAKRVALKYNYGIIDYAEKIRIADFDLVIIASPTATHYEWLVRCFNEKAKLVICEKPLSVSETELKELEATYKDADTKVVVNYIRRFQPSYKGLKKLIEEEEIMPVQIVVKYQRGLINNFSHAADLLEFFFGGGEFTNVHVIASAFDEFESDPTVSFTGNFKEIPLIACGLANVKYSYFEIEIFYPDKKISIFNSGDNITVKAAKNAAGFYPQLTELLTDESGILKNYMQYVYESILDIAHGKTYDNFMSSLIMGQQILKLIN